jgi:hypothetical protein
MGEGGDILTVWRSLSRFDENDPFMIRMVKNDSHQVSKESFLWLVGLLSRSIAILIIKSGYLTMIIYSLVMGQ